MDLFSIGMFVKMTPVPANSTPVQTPRQMMDAASKMANKVKKKTTAAAKKTTAVGFDTGGALLAADHDGLLKQGQTMSDMTSALAQGVHDQTTGVAMGVALDAALSTEVAATQSPTNAVQCASLNSTTRQ